MAEKLSRVPSWAVAVIGASLVVIATAIGSIWYAKVSAEWAKLASEALSIRAKAVAFGRAIFKATKGAGRRVCSLRWRSRNTTRKARELRSLLTTGGQFIFVAHSWRCGPPLTGGHLRRLTEASAILQRSSSQSKKRPAVWQQPRIVSSDHPRSSRSRMRRGYSRTRGILNAAASGSLTPGSTVQDQLWLGCLAARSR